MLKIHKLKTKSSIATPEVNFGLKEERRHKSVKANVATFLSSTYCPVSEIKYITISSGIENK